MKNLGSIKICLKQFGNVSAWMRIRSRSFSRAYHPARPIYCTGVISLGCCLWDRSLQSNLNGTCNGGWRQWDRTCLLAEIHPWLFRAPQRLQAVRWDTKCGRSHSGGKCLKRRCWKTRRTELIDGKSSARIRLIEWNIATLAGKYI